MDIHALYQGNLARPVPALLIQLASIAVGFAFAAKTLASQGPLVVGAELLVGLVVWTLFEYALHRWLMHSKIKKVWELLHQAHHQMKEMYDPEHRTMHPVVPIIVCGGILTLILRGSGGGAAVLLGYWIGYALYELVHWAHHDDRISGVFNRFDYYRRRAATHRDHHFKHPRANYGFTTQIWDMVFGTLVDFEGEAPGKLAPR